MINLNEYNRRVVVAEKIGDTVSALLEYRYSGDILTKEEIALLNRMGRRIEKKIWLRLHGEIIEAGIAIAKRGDVEYDQSLDII